jgi:hypothetical protein
MVSHTHLALMAEMASYEVLIHLQLFDTGVCYFPELETVYLGLE